jgi:hypothetical protein
LLIQLAFGVRVPFKQISVEGIRHVSQADIAFAREFGCVIKSLAVAKRAGDRIEASVRPTMVNRTHPLADVNGALNAIVVHGDALGASMYVGAGAGMMPTATAVVADLMDVARNRLHGCRGRIAPLGYPVRLQTRARTLAPEDLRGEYYLRFMVVDRPGVLGRLCRDPGPAGGFDRERHPARARARSGRAGRHPHPRGGGPGPAAGRPRDRPAERRARPLDRDPHRSGPAVRPPSAWRAARTSSST